MIDPHTMHMLTAMMAIMPIFILIGIAIVIIPYWMIWKKAGFSPWLSLLMFVPLLNLVMLYVFAFGTWPLERSRPQQSGLVYGDCGRNVVLVARRLSAHGVSIRHRMDSSDHSHAAERIPRRLRA